MQGKLSIVALIAVVASAFVATSVFAGSASAATQKTAVAAAPASAAHSTEVDATYWWGSQTWYSRSDVRSQANWWGVIRIANTVCNKAPGPLRTACNATVGAYTNWIYNTWMNAANTNQCVTMKMTWTGQVIGINAYGCNWG